VFLFYGGFNQLHYYAVYDPKTNTFGTAVSIPSTKVPIGFSGFANTIASDGSYLLTGGYAVKIYQSTISYTSQSVYV
jgi:hypothetical protein